LENLNSGNDERIDQLEKQLTEAKWIAEEADDLIIFVLNIFTILVIRKKIEFIFLAIIYYYFFTNPAFCPFVFLIHCYI
jgi:hypothetical protein